MKPRMCAGYSISKAALNMLTVHQSEDLKERLPGAVVISMDPGWVKTRMGGDGAILELSDDRRHVAGAAGLGSEDTGLSLRLLWREAGLVIGEWIGAPAAAVVRWPVILDIGGV